MLKKCAVEAYDGIKLAVIARNQRTALALYSVCARLIHRLTGGDICIDFGIGKLAKRYTGGGNA